MRSTFFGLNIGVSGLSAQQRSLEVTGHNIANANTPGFSRQEAVLTTTRPIRTNGGFVGTGVEVSTIRRIRDSYLDLQLRTENRAMGYWNFKADTLNKVEVVFNEPSNAGLRSTLDNFWSAWEDLTRAPESAAVRTTVIETGNAVVDTFNHMERQLKELRSDINESINVYTQELNAMARQIKDLNYTIVKAEAEGHKANDLRDARDFLMDQMSEIVDIDIIQNKNGSVAITIGGRAIVNGNVVSELKIEKDMGNDGLSKVVWSDGSEMKLREAGGKMKAMFEARDDLIKDKYMANLDLMAKSFAEAMNQQHAQGFHLQEDGANLKNYQGYSHGQKLDFDTPVVIDNSNNTLSFSVDGQPNVNITLAEASYTSMDALVAEINGQLSSNTDLQGQGLEVKAYNVNGAIRLLSTTVGDENKGIESSITIDHSSDAVDVLGLGVAQEINGKAPMFFVTTDATSGFSASNLTVNQDLKDDVNLLAAATNRPGMDGSVEGIKGDGSNALKIAQLKYDLTMIKGTTLDDFYRSETAKLGIETREANRMKDNQGLLVAQLENKREMVMGVSLDEEMTNMIRFQHAYNSSARYITTIDGMLDTLINRLGLVGR